MLLKKTSQKIFNFIKLLHHANKKVPLTIQQIGREMNIIYKDVQLLEEDLTNIRKQLYQVYEENKKRGDTPLTNISSSQKLFSGIRSNKLLSTISIPESTELSSFERQELYQQKCSVNQKNTQINKLKKQIDKLEQRLDIQKRNYEREIEYYEKQNDQLKQIFYKILNRGFPIHRQNRHTTKEGENANKSNKKTTMKRLKENPTKNTKVNSRNLKGNEKKSIIQALNESEMRDGPIYEKLCQLGGVTFIHSSLRQV